MQNFNLVRIIGLMSLGIGSFFLCITCPELAKLIENNRDLFREGIVVVFALGLAYFFIGIATMIKKKWTRLWLTNLFGISIVIYAYLFFFEFHLRGKDRYIVGSISLMLLILLICGSLYINNDKVINAYDSEDDLGFREDDILDL